MVFPFCSSLAFKYFAKGGNGQKESRSRKNSKDLPASEYYKIYQQTKQHNKQKTSFSDNELLQSSPTIKRRNESDFSTDSDHSNHNEYTHQNCLRTISSSLGELNNIENMDQPAVNRVPDIKIGGGGIADR
jgi:hypothetical protein